MHAGWCQLCVCDWACKDATSVPRKAMGNDVPSSEPGHLSQSDMSVHHDCIHMKACIADGGAHIYRQPNMAAGLDFLITHHKSPIF